MRPAAGAFPLAAAALLLLPGSLAAQDEPQDLLDTAAITAASYTVRAGDSMSVIARRMGVTVDALAAANRMVPPYILRVGQVLKRPAPGGPPPRATTPSPPPARKAALPPAKPPAKREPGAPRLVWPTSGAVTARFGATVKGLPNNGLDLAAFAGMTVHAAAAGKVVFAGTEPERFGQLIVIQHSGGWVTAYAYLGQVRVKEGQQVKSRQIIARIGKSGEARRPGLHFELRKGTAPRNPALYLPIRL